MNEMCIFRPFYRSASLLGRATLKFMEATGKLTLVFTRTTYWMFKPPFEGRNVWEQMVRMGVDSLPVVCLISLFTGMVMALDIGVTSQNIVNEPLFIGPIIGIAMSRELSPVATSLIVAGRVGSAITAELGTMKITEQTDALFTLGTNPFQYLSVPRFIAGMVTIPLLTIFSIFTGIMGGLLVAIWRLGIPFAIFADDFVTYVRLGDLFHGVIKSVFFAAIIVTVSCFKGLTVEGGAKGVGNATTSTVVISMVLVLIADFFLSWALMSMGIGG